MITLTPNDYPVLAEPLHITEQTATKMRAALAGKCQDYINGYVTALADPDSPSKMRASGERVAGAATPSTATAATR